MDNMPNVKRMADQVFDGLDELDVDIETYGATYVDKTELQKLHESYTKEQNHKVNKMFQPVLEKGFNKPHFEGMEELVQEPKRAVKPRRPQRVSIQQSLSESLFSPSNSRPKPWNRKKDDLSDSDSDSDSDSANYNIKQRMNKRIKPPTRALRATTKKANLKRNNVNVSQKQKPKPRWK